MASLKGEVVMLVDRPGAVEADEGAIRQALRIPDTAYAVSPSA